MCFPIACCLNVPPQSWCWIFALYWWIPVGSVVLITSICSTVVRFLHVLPLNRGYCIVLKNSEFSQERYSSTAAMCPTELMHWLACWTSSCGEVWTSLGTDIRWMAATVECAWLPQYLGSAFTAFTVILKEKAGLRLLRTWDLWDSNPCQG